MELMIQDHIIVVIYDFGVAVVSWKAYVFSILYHHILQDHIIVMIYDDIPY